MNRIALNTVAVFIFLMTGLILGGPLLQISPVVPTAVILLALAIASLDAVGFQGQGATLFLDGVAQRSPEYRARIVHHEAGHFLVAYRLGIPVTGYTLCAWDAWRQGYGGSGGVQFKVDLQNQPNPAAQLENYSAVCMAGRAAEQLVYQTIEGGVDDLAWLRQQAASLEIAPTSLEQRSLLVAKGYLKDYWAAYEQLVEAMTQNQSVEQCYGQLAAAGVPNQSRDRYPII
jgi:hypothetical protein